MNTTAMDAVEIKVTIRADQELRAERGRDERTRVPLGRIGVVFDRPLPYMYLAREVFAQGGVPFDARDALPLGAEPFAAAVDLVLRAGRAADHQRFAAAQGHCEGPRDAGDGRAGAPGR